MKLLKQLGRDSGNSGTSLKRGANERLLFALLLALLARPDSVSACAACYGQSDSPLASGVTWGILSLLVVVMGVLGSIVTFFVYINKKSTATAALSPAPIIDYQSPVTNYQPVTNH